MVRSAQLLQVPIEAALEESPRLAAANRAAVAAREQMPLRLAAHTLKGSLRTFGDTPAFVLAERLENMGREGSFRHAAEACDRLNVELAEVIGSMYDYLQGASHEHHSHCG